MIDTTIPHAARCSFCGSYQPLLRVECQSPDDFIQLWRFFCSTDHIAKWESNQPRPNDAALPVSPSCPAQAELSL